MLFIACLSPLASDCVQSSRTLTYTQQMTGLSSKAKQSAPQKRFMAEGLKRLANAVESGDAAQIREAIRIAQHHGIVGPERRRAVEALQKLEAVANDENCPPMMGQIPLELDKPTTSNKVAAPSEQDLAIAS